MKDTKNPKISVIMPAYNCEEFISEAIESILNQTYKDFEFIILDDCSSDKTWEIIYKYSKNDKRIKAYKNEKNLGIGDSLNKCIDLSSGDYLARMDADDWSYPYRFELQVNFLNRHKEVGIIGGNIEAYDSKLTNKLGTSNYFQNDCDLKKNIFLQTPFTHPCIMYRKEVVLKNRYNNLLPPAEDYDFYFRVGNDFKFHNLKEVILKYRTHKSQLSSAKIKIQNYYCMYIRLKAWIEYGYKPTKYDIFHNIIKLILIPIFPKSIKDFLFTFFWKGPGL